MDEVIAKRYGYTLTLIDLHEFLVNDRYTNNMLDYTL